MLEQVKKNAGYKTQNALKGVKFFSEPLFSRRRVKPETFSLSENGRLEARFLLSSKFNLIRINFTC